MLTPAIFSKNLKRLMVRRGFGPTDLARETGRKKQQISRYLNGHQIPERETIEELAKALNGTYAELVEVGEDQESVERARLEAIRLIVDTDDDTLSIVLRALRRPLGASSASKKGKASPR